jgi:hypothetical protein
MQNRFRDFLACASAVGLVFCCSCERHHPNELPHEREYIKSDAAGKEGPHDAQHEKAISDQQQMSTTALTPTPSPSPTPADFFPAGSPH